MEQNLEAASSVCKTKLTAGSGPLQGTLAFVGGEVLNLQQSEDKLWSVELASIFAGVKGELAALAKRSELKVQQEVRVWPRLQPRAQETQGPRRGGGGAGAVGAPRF